MYSRYILRIVVPTLLTVALFVVTIFLVLIPALERGLLERKREMIRELTTSAWNILASFEQEVTEGRLTRAAAQQEAVRQIRNLHYGPQLKDYFWVNDLTPRMIVHPYRHELEGQDLSGIQDPTGKRLFVEFVTIARAQGGGFVRYQWQWKDDPRRTVPKLSYVKLFEPWGWIIGTGIYLDDVAAEIHATSRRLALSSGGILAAVLALLGIILHHGLNAERARRQAEAALRASEERYRLLVESAGESIILALGRDRLYANANALQLLGYTAEEFATLRLQDVIKESAPNTAGPDLDRAAASPLRATPARHESELIGKDNRTIPVLLSYAPIVTGGQEGVIVVATDITARKAAEAALDRSHSALRDRFEELRQQAAEREASLRELQTALLLRQAPAGGGSVEELFARLREAATPDELATLNRQWPVLVQALTAMGYRAEAVNRLITVNTDTVLETLLPLVLRQLGQPPAPFVFLVLGSEGRREQTLCTDQDNAILYADPPAADADAVAAYFLELGRQVCDGLSRAGYTFCTGGIMASQPAWCRPLSAWQREIAMWISTLEAQDLLQAKIFFDYRRGYGDAALLEPLRETLREALAAHPRFLAQLARNVLLFRPPVGLFGGIAVETVGTQRKVFDIKSAMTPIVDFGRLYALRHGVVATNTLERLSALLAAGVLTPQNHEEIVQVYGALMQIRIESQLAALAAHRPPDNLVAPERLTHLQRRLLRESFAQIHNFQTRLSYDFTGLPGGMP